MRSIILAVSLCLALGMGRARAETFPVIENQTVLKECGDCHTAFPPQTLTKAVWRKIILGMDNHFGEKAALDPTVAGEILRYHEANASDVSDTRAAMKWTADVPFERLTEGPRFKNKHKGCSDGVWKSPKVKLKSNCLACHETMQTDGSTDANLTFLPRDLQVQCNSLGAFGVFMDGIFK